MHPFSYLRVTDAQSAVGEVAAVPDATFVAGGSTLLDLMKLNVMTPARLIDINALPLNKIEALADGSVRIGAMVRNSDMAYDETIRSRYPLLSEALLSGASAQLRNVATLGGNIMQRTRCFYFRDTAMPCNKREPGSGCAAMEGINRIHAVLGTSSKCIAAHPSDMCVALTALDAVVHVQGPKGERTIPFSDFHLLPADHPEHETALEHGELITAVTLAALPFGARSHYLKVRDRASYAFALVSVATALDVQQGMIRNVRLALGGVGTKPWRAHEAEQALHGKHASEAAYRAAAEIAMRGAKTHKYNAFKVELAKRAIVRALKTVEAMA